MIFVTHQLPVNVEGEPRLDRAADSMTGDYLKAVAATLNAMRRLAQDAVSA